MEWRAQLVGLRNSIPCHGVHDLVKMCHLVNLVRNNNWGVRERVTPKESMIHEGGTFSSTGKQIQSTFAVLAIIFGFRIHPVGGPKSTFGFDSAVGVT